jgi:chemotaxis protein methyltransferase CheR
MEMSPLAVRVLSGLLEERTGQQLVLARQWRVETALGPMMRERQIGSLDQLAGMIALGRDPQLIEAVIESLLNNETFFFRDIPAFELLMAQAAGRLSEARRAEKRLRIWSAGCSTGQEAYSLAISFAEQADRWAGWKIEILGTDVSRDAILRARTGSYTQFEIQRGLPIRQMLAWFNADGEQWRARPDLREKVSFNVHNLMGPPPAAGRFDIILCRNVLLYFSAERRRAVFARLASAIAPDGVLMLGAGETIIGQTEDFLSDADCRGLYRARNPIPQSGAPVPVI